MAMDFVDAKSVLVIQHDLSFIVDVDYTALIQSMEDNPEFLNIVRFHKKKNIPFSDWMDLEDEEARKYCSHPFRDEKNYMTFIPH